MKNPRFWFPYHRLLKQRHFVEYRGTNNSMTENTKKEIHIGLKIREELRRQGRSNRWFAEQLNINQRTVNKIFDKVCIDTQQLLRISRVLKVDFFKYFSESL